ncbi:hypothetical protein [Olsenella phocaeensis]|uniref:hypothetical protein n=1 Tax=Olsenella phocaeensis TaxID=1852385 RepID=UPI000931CCCE|nr:hypothetical protein [Olsenella phocaeensis]
MKLVSDKSLGIMREIQNIIDKAHIEIEDSETHERVDLDEFVTGFGYGVTAALYIVERGLTDNSHAMQLIDFSVRTHVAELGGKSIAEMIEEAEKQCQKK